MYGRRERGHVSDGTWNWATGKGYVKPIKGDYARAGDLGVTVLLLLVESFGGFGPELDQMLSDLAAARQNKLTKSEYDDTTRAARTWKSFSAQKLSVAVHRSMAGEVARALGLASAADPRGYAA